MIDLTITEDLAQWLSEAADYYAEHGKNKLVNSRKAGLFEGLLMAQGFQKPEQLSLIHTNTAEIEAEGQEDSFIVQVQEISDAKRRKDFGPPTSNQEAYVVVGSVGDAQDDGEVDMESDTEIILGDQTETLDSFRVGDRIIERVTSELGRVTAVYTNAVAVRLDNGESGARYSYEIDHQEAEAQS